MQTPVVPRAAIVATDSELNASAVSWGAVFAGAAAAAALSYILVILGFGLGLSSVSPWTNAGASATAIGVATIAWLTFTQIVASGMGGYLAGRLRVRWAGAHTDEVYFRDTAHGFLSWGVASLVVAAFLANAIGGVLSGGASVAGSIASGASQVTSAAAPAIADVARDTNTGYFVDSLFRGNSATDGTTPPTSNDSTRDSQAEATKIFVHSIASGSLSAPDKQYLGQMVAARTGMSQPDAQQRVDAAYTSMSQSIETAKAKAKEAADQARKVTAGLALWMFISLLCGAFFASLAATFGGRRRDL
ncbi:MAG: hypothetical protein ACREPX_02300 [Rhodanobacteraceae bacterium]